MARVCRPTGKTVTAPGQLGKVTFGYWPVTVTWGWGCPTGPWTEAQEVLPAGEAHPGGGRAEFPGPAHPPSPSPGGEESALPWPPGGPPGPPHPPACTEAVLSLQLLSQRMDKDQEARSQGRCALLCSNSAAGGSGQASTGPTRVTAAVVWHREAEEEGGVDSSVGGGLARKAGGYWPRPHKSEQQLPGCPRRRCWGGYPVNSPGCPSLPVACQ